MKKTDRELIRMKFNNRCAYCGCELTKGWHVDELLPCERKYKRIDAYYENIITKEKSPISNPRDIKEEQGFWRYIPSKLVHDGYFHPERLIIENQMPACASCNINKHSMSLEDFRSLIKGFMKHLNELSVQYKIAKRYGLVTENDIEVKFYFEQYKELTT